MKNSDRILCRRLTSLLLACVMLLIIPMDTASAAAVKTEDQKVRAGDILIGTAELYGQDGVSVEMGFAYSTGCVLNSAAVQAINDTLRSYDCEIGTADLSTDSLTKQRFFTVGADDSQKQSIIFLRGQLDALRQQKENAVSGSDTTENTQQTSGSDITAAPTETEPTETEPTEAQTTAPAVTEPTEAAPASPLIMTTRHNELGNQTEPSSQIPPSGGSVAKWSIWDLFKRPSRSDEPPADMQEEETVSGSGASGSDVSGADQPGANAATAQTTAQTEAENTASTVFTVSSAEYVTQSSPVNVTEYNNTVSGTNADGFTTESNFTADTTVAPIAITASTTAAETYENSAFNIDPNIVYTNSIEKTFFTNGQYNSTASLPVYGTIEQSFAMAFPEFRFSNITYTVIPSEILQNVDVSPSDDYKSAAVTVTPEPVEITHSVFGEQVTSIMVAPLPYEYNVKFGNIIGLMDGVIAPTPKPTETTAAPTTATAGFFTTTLATLPTIATVTSSTYETETTTTATTTTATTTVMTFATTSTTVSDLTAPTTSYNYNYNGSGRSAYVATRRKRLRLRSGPGFEYRIKTHMPKGTHITVLNTSNEKWYYVRMDDGTEGYCWSGYVGFY